MDEPEEGTIVLSLYLPKAREKAFVALTRDGAFSTDARPKGRAADSVIVRLRRELNGGWLAAIETCGPKTRLRVERKDGALFLTMHRRSFLLRTQSEQRVVGRATTAPPFEGAWSELEFKDLRAFVPKESASLEMGKRLIKKKLKKTQRTQKKVAADMERSERAPRLRHEANLLMANAHCRAHDGALEVLDWETGEPRRFEIEGTIAGAAEQRYTLAKRFERGKAKAEARLDELAKEADQLKALLDEFEQGATSEDEVEARLFSVGIRIQAGGPKRGQNRAPRVPYRTFVGRHGKVLVGRGAKDNDELTLKVAKPFDHWLHVRGRPGSHVVVPLTRGAEIGSDLLVDAAHLAAHFSNAAGDVVVEVDHLPRRHLRKIKGAAPGSVTLIRSKTITIRIDDARLKALLASEVR